MQFDQNKYNPCLKEQTLTYKCLDKNDYVKEKCRLQMDNYNMCKKFWIFVSLMVKSAQKQELEVKYFGKIMCNTVKLKINTQQNTCPALIQGKVKAERRRNGIRPYLPDVEEREKIKEEEFRNRKARDSN